MRTRLLYVWGVLQASFWFNPLLIILLGMALAFGFLWLDGITSYEPSGYFAYMTTGSTASARILLSTIAGAMIGVAGTVFSITLVALTLASSQFGSRLLRNFMHDRLNQAVLGSYVSTFIYCLLILRAVKSDETHEFVPNLSILFAIAVAVANILLLIIFIHHISTSIQADKVISDINYSMNKRVRALFPEEWEEEPEYREIEVGALKESLPVVDGVSAKGSGYLQAVDVGSLIKIAKEKELLLTLNFRPGEFLVKNIEMVQLHSEKECDPESKEKIQSAFIIGKTRTPLQDAEYAIHQMVEIAVRALSPGVNDPYTVITCIDYLTATMCYLARANYPSPWRYDDEGKLRVITKPLTFSGMLDAAFNQIRQFSVGSPSILIRLIESITTINRFARDEAQREAVLRHAEMVLRAAEASIEEKNDLEDLRNRYQIMQPES